MCFKKYRNKRVCVKVVKKFITLKTKRLVWVFLDREKHDQDNETGLTKGRSHKIQNYIHSALFSLLSLPFNVFFAIDSLICTSNIF